MRSFRLLRRPATPTAFACWLCKRNSPASLTEPGSIFRTFSVETFTLAHIFRLRNEASDATLRKWIISRDTLKNLATLVRQKPL